MTTLTATPTAKLWRWKQVTNLLGNATEMIQLTSTEDKAHISNNDNSNSADYLRSWFKKTSPEQISKPCQTMVHKDLLCLFSVYYRKMLQSVGSDIFNNPESVRLGPETCRMFVGWLYTGQLTYGAGWKSLFSLYVFADEVEMLALRRTVMTNIVRSYKTPWIPPVEDAAAVLKLLPSSTPLYMWLLDAFTHHWDPEHDKPSNSLPSEFLMDWVKRALVRKCAIEEKKTCAGCPCCRENPCHYHEHESLEEWRLTCYPNGVSESDRPMVIM
ncbi:hypothetical protein KCU65_g6183, partial [Aureobasidium melanogenum]